MNELIKVEVNRIGEQEVPSVDARELHAFLDINHRFNDWIVNRIEEYGFEEGRDFCYFFSKNISKANQEDAGKGRPKKEYLLTLDTAKELCMVERNEQGRQARRYFIECERRLKESEGLARPALTKEQTFSLRILEFLRTTGLANDLPAKVHHLLTEHGLSMNETAKQLDITAGQVRQIKLIMIDAGFHFPLSYQRGKFVPRLHRLPGVPS